MANESPLTYAEARAMLYRYAHSDPQDTTKCFRDALNQVLERIFSTGIWRGMRVRESLTPYITANVMTLPYGYDSVTAVAVDDIPYDIVTEEHEFTAGGPGVQAAGEGGSLIVDLGFVEETGQEVRKYKFLFDTSNANTVEGLCVRKYVYVSADADAIRPSNVGALKLGLIALTLEDAGNLPQATQYWAACRKTLSEEKTNDLQGHKRPNNQNPWGWGIGKETNIT